DVSPSAASGQEPAGGHGRDPEAQGRPGVGSRPASDQAVAEPAVEETFLSVVDEGRRRMSRRLPSLLFTGAVGGIDVGTGVLALLLVEQATQSKLLGGLAFSIGFIAMTLARSELFTEDFLIPVSTVIARQARLRMLVRLWTGTVVANLAGGWIFTWFIIHGYPKLSETAVTAGNYYVQLGIGLRAFCLAVLGGAVITLMTWMQHGSSSEGARIVAAIAAAFLLGAGQLDHAIVNSLLMFAALQTGHAPFGYLQWAETAGWAALGNMVGGVGLVTLLRLLQVPHKVQEERANPAPGVPIGDTTREPAIDED
ncbi:MAG TPA: formate/nitrite transporter family protein, partial [Acidimicrobiales bacterium]|nr:formate/nitrite transporter family protein [Acidimicrobiales bacterium]